MPGTLSAGQRRANAPMPLPLHLRRLSSGQMMLQATCTCALQHHAIQWRAHKASKGECTGALQRGANATTCTTIYTSCHALSRCAANLGRKKCLFGKTGYRSGGGLVVGPHCALPGPAAASQGRHNVLVRSLGSESMPFLTESTVMKLNRISSSTARYVLMSCWPGCSHNLLPNSF